MITGRLRGKLMGVGISYMGTKRELAPAVAGVIARAQSGAFLDAFSGMCSVAEAVGTTRQIWTNDAQIFASSVGEALFTSLEEPLGPVEAADRIFEAHQTTKSSLARSFQRSIDAEDRLSLNSLEDFQRGYIAFKSALVSDLSLFIDTPYCLFTKSYADSYFGIAQCIEIDAIIGSITQSSNTTPDQRRWMTIALGRSMLRVANSTGHFAQFLKPKAGSYKTFIRQRRRSVWQEWLNAIDDMNIPGTREWRSGNRAFNLDSLTLIPQLSSMRDRPSVVYADPPYTADHYSRYYHVLETLMRYDYPEVMGEGRYRPDRFHTPFSIKSLAIDALDRFVGGVARAGADLVLSYPTNGLIYQCGCDPLSVLKKHFRRVEIAETISHAHSTLGASKGPSKALVQEQIFWGRA